jgi:hypothetical protein
LWGEILGNGNGELSGDTICIGVLSNATDDWLPARIEEALHGFLGYMDVSSWMMARNIPV